MHDLHTSAGALHGIQVLSSAFLAILFLQSGIDKVVDRRGNLEWLNGHFAKSPLAGMVPAMVTVITILEIVAGGPSAERESTRLNSSHLLKSYAVFLF